MNRGTPAHPKTSTQTMGDYITIRNWEKFQQYKDRRPTWIKAYVELLDHYEFSHLPDASKAHLMGLWLLAAVTGNRIPADPAWIAKKINATSEIDLELLKSNGFIQYESSEASVRMIEAVCSLEKRREEKSRVETDVSSSALAIPDPPPPSDDTPARFVASFNATFDRGLGVSPEIPKRIKARLGEGYKRWQIVALPVMVEAQGLASDMRRALRPDILLRDGKHPRTSASGVTCGGTDWLERALGRLDQTVLDSRLASIAEQIGVLDQLKQMGVGIREDSGL